MIRLFTKAQNSSSVCQSRPLRARREASMANTAPAVPVQMAANRRSNPGRAVRSRATEIIVDDDHILPAKRTGSRCEGILAAAALRIVEQLVRRRLPYIDIGATRQVIRRDLTSSSTSTFWLATTHAFRRARSRSMISERIAGLTCLRSTSLAASTRRSSCCHRDAVPSLPPSVRVAQTMAMRIRGEIDESGEARAGS